jgi:hypothetical protein
VLTLTIFFRYRLIPVQITLNVLAQIIPGSLLPGKPLTNMIFKAYAVQTLSEATSFVQDLKLGHYVKVPPKATFLGGYLLVVQAVPIDVDFLSVQSVATILAAFIQVGVKEWLFATVPDMCTRNQPSKLTCPHNQVFFTASAVWCDPSVFMFCQLANCHILEGVSSGRLDNSEPARSITHNSGPSS